LYLSPFEIERAQGMPDARCTRGLVCNVHKEVRTRAYRAAEAIRHSLRNGFTAYSALSPATNSSCHRHQRISDLAKPGWARNTSANLTPATGARTTRFCRTQPPVFAKRLRRASRCSSACCSIAHGLIRPAISSHANAPRPPQPAPTFVTMANAPLLGTGWHYF
jgi:hypothetical protein